MDHQDNLTDEKLAELEAKWSERLQRVTVPLPSMQNSMRLIEKIKQSDAVLPSDPRAELEHALRERSMAAKLLDLLRAQWNVYGSVSWLLTGLGLLASTCVPIVKGVSSAKDVAQWVMWLTLVLIASIGYAYRPKNEGMAQLEKLGRYTLMEQVTARFVLVLGFELVCTMGLSFLVPTAQAMPRLPHLSLLTAWSVPMLFFGALGFLLVQRLSSSHALAICIALWALQAMLRENLTAPNLFSMPGEPYFWQTHIGVLGISLLILVVVFVFGVRREKREHANSIAAG